MNFFIYTFGCKTNTYESESMSRLLSETGRYQAVSDYLSADVVIVNSCMVTGESEKKAAKLIRRIRRENEKACIVLCGCMPQVIGEAAFGTGADVICGNTKRADIVKAVDSYFEKKTISRDMKIFRVEPHLKDETFELLAPDRYKNLTRANLKIEDGCECFCSYCVIPFARGRVRSMPPDEVFKVAKDLVNSGHREIVLTGINIGMYGKDIGLSICDAVKAVSDAGAERIRLGSIEIDLISDAAIEELSGIPGLCPHFHTSLQSGSAKILKRMNRRYDPEEYMRKTGLLRSSFANASVTTDVIVGFPGETEEDFNDTVEFVRRAGFFRIHVFPYSKRNGTAAAGFKDQIPVEIKKRRVVALEEVAAELKKNFLTGQVGKTVNVLFERSSGGFARGHAENYVEVRVETEEDLRNRIVSVTVSGVDSSGDFVYGNIG
ncbi:MAG: tRNA (N(6)-L-threonylcarbamoyladenosine(37)-C(2))-methylthiotransferase MtaB [Clostridia bacterium]|nr:tRNA (N(6)-L-threonylcarbamoyladenosine(37)-C(2))-methylthiotransferase MtaB [Clostridia bacterium]